MLLESESKLAQALALALEQELASEPVLVLKLERALV